MFNMDECFYDADYAVFDDLIGGFEFFRNYKGWLGCQEEFTLSDKYKKKTKIHMGQANNHVHERQPNGQQPCGPRMDPRKL